MVTGREYHLSPSPSWWILQEKTKLYGHLESTSEKEKDLNDTIPTVKWLEKNFVSNVSLHFQLRQREQRTCLLILFLNGISREDWHTNCVMPDDRFIYKSTRTLLFERRIPKRVINEINQSEHYCLILLLPTRLYGSFTKRISKERRKWLTLAVARSKFIIRIADGPRLEKPSSTHFSTSLSFCKRFFIQIWLLGNCVTSCVSTWTYDQLGNVFENITCTSLERFVPHSSTYTDKTLNNSDRYCLSIILLTHASYSKDRTNNIKLTLIQIQRSVCAQIIWYGTILFGFSSSFIF